MTVDVDYLIVGGGAIGMAFADVLVDETEATLAIVDRHDRPGGHWNEAYPFVRLHQPASSYGVESMPLGADVIDEVGLNRGYYGLASGQEVLDHFDAALQRRLLPSGRVHWFPMSEVDDDGTVTSLLSGARTEVHATKVVDAASSRISIPATHRRPYAVGEGVVCVPPNDLPRIAPEHRSFVVVGAGKTGMDACLWLLANGADPDSIRWVMPRDRWLLDRANFQPGQEFLERVACSLADQVEALAAAESYDDLFARLERAGELRRIDPSVTPEAYHCAIIGEAELDELRRIKDVVRLGRLLRIDRGEMTLEGGPVATSVDSLFIDCSATGILSREPTTIFAGSRITPQLVRMCQPVFSAAFVAHVESGYDDDAEKNRICRPVPPPAVPTDWVRMMAVELANRHTWSQIPDIRSWLSTSRLDGGFSRNVRALTGSESTTIAHLGRYAQYVAAALVNADRLLGDGSAPPSSA